MSANRILRLIGSAPMAIVLLSVLAVICVIGSLIPQNEALEYYRSNYPPVISTMISALRLDRLYDSWWFLLLLSFIAVNLVISNWRRASRILRDGRKPAGNVNPELFQSSEAVISLDTEKEKGDLFPGVLRRMGYSVDREERGEGTVFHAEKGRIRLWGSFITHLGLLIVFIGVIAGRALPGNFSDYVEIDEGKSAAVPGRGFSLRLISFSTDVNERGMPRSHRSTVAVEENGKAIRESVISVNHPLRYGGVLFYQASCGIRSLEVEVKKGDHAATLSFPVLPGGQIAVRERFQQSRDPEITVYIHNFFPHFVKTEEGIGNFSPYPANPVIRVFAKEAPLDEKRQWEEIGFMGLGDAVTKDGITFTFKRVVQWSGLLVRVDSGMFIVWAGFIIVLVGLFASLYIPRRVIRALMAESGPAIHFEIIAPEDSFSESEERALSELFPALGKDRTAT